MQHHVLNNYMQQITCRITYFIFRLGKICCRICCLQDFKILIVEHWKSEIFGKHTPKSWFFATGHRTFSFVIFHLLRKELRLGRIVLPLVVLVHVNIPIQHIAVYLGIYETTTLNRLASHVYINVIMRLR